jgi:hypothetical protein
MTARLSVAPARPIGETPAMRTGLGAYVGRERERAALRAGLDELARGRGGLWLVSGEPGMGKSRLVEEVVPAAEAAGATVAWGRCWEAGGAPAYWPWTQLLRGLVRGDAAVERAPLLAQILPELRERGAPATPALSPERARFELLDAVWRVLDERARRGPLVLVLDDLHAADPSSLLLLDFVGHQVRAAPIAIVGTFRDSDAHRGEAGPLLLKVSRHATAIPLVRLGDDDVAAYLREAIGAAPAPELAAQVAQRTDGNPLFLVELTRLLVSHGPSVAAARAVPPTVRTAIGERLVGLSALARTVLERAAIIGRDVSVAALVEAFTLGADDVRDALDEAAAAMLVLPVAADAYRFAHILVRDVLYQGVGDERRAALHRRLADAMRRRGDSAAPWSQIAHHLFAAGPSARADAIDAAERAAQRAIDGLAFEDAIVAYRLALDASAGSDPAAQRRRGQLLLGLGRARAHAGDRAGGRAACVEAAALARQLGDGELLAHAALAAGAVLTLAEVDRDLVALLEEAAAALGDGDSALRARVLARLAAATQPARDPEPPMAMARTAIAMARRVGDPPTLLAVLGSGCSTLMDLAPPAERVILNREHAALATALADRGEAVRGHLRLVFDCFELGELPAAGAAIETIERLAREVGQAHVGWRAVALGATRALWEGRMGDAERLAAEARDVGERSGDPNAHATAVFQRVRLLRLAGRDPELCAALPDLRGLFRSTEVIQGLMDVMSGAHLIAAGRRDEGLAWIGAEAIELSLGIGDRSVLDALAEVAYVSGDRTLAARLHQRMVGEPDLFLSTGVIGMTWEMPMRRPLALVTATLGRLDEAIGHLERGIGLARAAGGAAVAAWMGEELAGFLARRDGPGDRARSAVLAREVAAAAGQLGLAGIAARAAVLAGAAAAPSARPIAAPAARPCFSIRRDGEVWILDHAGTSFRLRDSRGLQLLARLVEAPGQEIHVLDLGAPGEAGVVDLGDAGEDLDASARAAYRERIAALESARAEAESWNDRARADAAQRELDALAAELARAFGLGGRGRRTGAAAERARINVQRRLRDAIRRIAAHDDPLARHLERSVRTGVFCAYDPA